MLGGKISLTLPKLKKMEEGPVSPHWLANTRATLGFPWNWIWKTSFWPAAPKGLMTYAFIHMGNFLLLLLLLLRIPLPPNLKAHIPALRLLSQPRGPNPRREAQIPTSRPKSQPQGPNSSLKVFGPWDWDFDLVAEIWASRLRYGPRAWGKGGVRRRRRLRRRRKFPICLPSYCCWILTPCHLYFM